MKLIIILTILIFTISAQQQGAFKQCMKNALTNSCRNQVYQCFNNSDCSYQLHTNTQHIFIRDGDTSIPKMYFSNPIGVALHQCLNEQCKIGSMDAGYPATLPADYCVMEVWDICGGDVQQAYAGKASQQTMKCYKQLCPSLKKKLDL